MRSFDHRSTAHRWAIAIALSCAVAALFGVADAFAQARNPFSVGISEGGGSASGIAGWILAKQSEFERLLSGAVRAVKGDGHAMWTLAGLSFAYGVFHAAGPGHGKAVVASYMLANERALRRGLAIALMAAVLQGLVAIAIVGILALLLNATAQRMKDAASFVETASYAGIAALGLYLVFTKGSGLLAALRRRTHHSHDHAPAVAETAHHDHDHAAHAHVHTEACAHDHHDHGAHDGHHHEPLQVSLAHEHDHDEQDHAAHVHDEHCGHFHAPDPRTLGDGFSWWSAIGTVVAAGSRPCSGAILVLVFALAQGVFLAGVGATVAMSLGTAITTGALAAMAVFAKSIALRFTGESSSAGLLIGRGFEFLAACAVFLLGLGLLLGGALGNG